MSELKHESGDRWGLVRINTDTGKETRVQIGGWESSTFAWRKQARDYAQGYNKIAQQYGHPERYEERYAGNWQQRTGDHWWWV